MRLRAISAALLVLVAACTGASAPPGEAAGLRVEVSTDQADEPAPPPTTAERRPMFSGFARTYQGDVELAALAEHGVDVYESPGEVDPFLSLPATTILGTTTVVGLVGEPHNGWAEVRLPVRPLGSTGWIRTDDVDLFVVSGRIVVDISDRTLTYFQSEVEVMTTEVAVGSDRSPTPLGHFYVTDSVTLTRQGTPWGPHALGLSARSEHVTEFNGGDGIIGIHGTSHPSSIGQAASLGCVRLHNDQISRLHTLVPVGTPVEIRA